MSEELTLNEDGYICFGKDEDGYPVIIGSVLWSSKNRRHHPVNVACTVMPKHGAFRIVSEAIAAWNRRADTPAVEGLVDAVESHVVRCGPCQGTGTIPTYSMANGIRCPICGDLRDKLSALKGGQP